MQKETVLVVEDQKFNQAILKEILEKECELIYANNGQEGVEAISVEGDNISLIILDINMPVMDGYEVLEWMGKEGYIGKIPVLVASYAEQGDSELRALLLGASDYVSKPFNHEVLKRRAFNLIRMEQAIRRVNILEHDEVTGLYNKAAFCKRVDELFDKYPQKQFDMISIDVEHFKLFNESYGFKEGDRLLCYIAKELTLVLEGKCAECAREYGDRFLVVQERNKKCFDVLHDRLVTQIKKYPLDIKVHLNFGIYEIEEKVSDIQTICDKAISATKRNQGQYDQDVSYYDDSVREQMYLEQQITDEMVDALRAGQFQVYLQPKYDLFTEKMAGAEALVRWIHPTKGVISPSEFIPIFEKTGFISELDMYVWDKTCAMLAEWIKDDNKYVPVSVNVSRKDIYKDNLPQIFQGLLKKYGLKPKHLHLEITESAYTENPDQLLNVVERLKALGFTIEMDDFGSGYSSLNMLSKLPIDVLKLDIRIIQSYGEKNSSRSVINFIMGLARWMNLYVVAEGVETQQQIDLLRSLDCNYVQGYYFAKPMPGDAFENRLNKDEVSIMHSADDDVTNAKIFVRDFEKEHVLLVVDDLAMNRAILTDYFKDQFSIVEATDGDAALNYFSKGGKADLIILDIYMPHMDGYETLKALKEDEKTREIPVIISSQADDETIIRVMKEGASDFMTKPFTKEDAFRCVNNVWTNRKKEPVQAEEELRERMTVMEKLATTDFLTGLWNQSQLKKRVTEYLDAHKDLRCSFILIDVDDFREINEKYGHMRGDEILQQLAERLLYCFREEDIVARLEGDEFAVLMKSAMGVEELEARMKVFHKMVTMEVDDIKLTCSSGVCIYPEEASDYTTLYKKADKALFRAKRAGKNQSYIFNDK